MRNLEHNIFLEDVLDQPNAMGSAIASYARYGELLKQLRDYQFRQVLFTGMGSSHYCSQSAVIRLNQSGVPARMESASEILHYEWKAITPDTLLVLTSQSGESGEIVSILERLPDKLKVVGITNDPDSALGRRADIRLEMRVAPELAVSTRTYLSSLILSDMLASALLGETVENSLKRSTRAIDALEVFVHNHKELQEQISSFLGHPETLCFIGRGHGISTAECSALFTRETAKYPALAFDSGEFRHGPFEMVDQNFRAMIFAPSGDTLQLQCNLAEAISGLWGKVVFVTDAELSFDSEHVLVIRHPKVEESSAPIVQIAAGQLFANEMALYRGHRPGVFRQSNKITTVQ